MLAAIVARDALRPPRLHSANGFQQLSWSNAQAVSQLNDVLQAHVSFAAFYATHVVPMQIRQLRQLFLRELAL